MPFRNLGLRSQKADVGLPQPASAKPLQFFLQ